MANIILGNQPTCKDKVPKFIGVAKTPMLAHSKQWQGKETEWVLVASIE